MALNGSAPPDRPLRFGGFVFDPGRAELRDAAGGVVPLRPKTRALLEHLLSRSGRVAERGAILEAVWPGVTVGDESLSQAVAELRRALGPDGARLIRTVPRRGYVLDGAVAEGEPGGAAATAASPPPPAGAEQARVPRRRVAWFAMPVLAGILVAWWIGAWPAAPSADQAPPSAVAVTGPAATAPTPPAAPARSPRETAEALHQEGLRVARDETGCRTRWVEARALFERAVAADPLFAPAHAEAAFAYSSAVEEETSLNPAEDLQAAERLARRAVELAPDRWVARAVLAQVLRQQRRHEEALAAYREAVALGGTNTARANVARILLALGRTEEAEAPLRAVLAEQGPDSLHVGMRLHALGLVELHLGRGDRGAENIRRSLDRVAPTPHDVRRLHLAAALALGGRVEDARAVAADVLGREPELGIAYMRARAESDNPVYLAQREALYRGLALAGVPEGRATARPPRLFSRSCVPAPPSAPPSALPDTASAAAPPPSPRQEAWRLLRDGQRAFAGPSCPDNWLAARPLYERAVAADPSFAPAYTGAAITYVNVVRNGLSASPVVDLRAAERLTEQAAALAPDLPQAHNVRGALRLVQERLEEALAAYGRAVALDGSSHPARANVGYLLIWLGRAEEAEAPLRASIALDPQNGFRGDWQTWLGLVDLLLGRGDHGVEHFRAALPHTGTYTAESRRLYLAAALALGGRVDDARAVAAEVLARDSGLSMAAFRRAPGSDNPVYRAQIENLYRGLALAGVPDRTEALPDIVRISCGQRFADAR